MNQLAPIADTHAPALVAAPGARASYRFLEFFTAQIRNPHTRHAYAGAATEFFDWLAAKGVTQITAIESVHVATYIEQLQRAQSAPTAKLRLAALRHLFDWMVIGQIMPTNPAAAVRGPRHIVRRGKTPVLDPAEARQLIDARHCRHRTLRCLPGFGFRAAHADHAARFGGARDPVDRLPGADPFAGHRISPLAQPGDRCPRRVRKPSRRLGQIDDSCAVCSPQQVDHQRQLGALSRSGRRGVSADVVQTDAILRHRKQLRLRTSARLSCGTSVTCPPARELSRHCHGAPGLRRSRWPGSRTRMNKISYSGYRPRSFSKQYGFTSGSP